MSVTDNLKTMLNERRAREAVASVGLALPRTIEGIEYAERAAVMIVANAMLLSAVGEYGRALSAAPWTLPRAKLTECLTRLGASLRKLNGSLEEVSDASVGDVVYQGVLRQIRATEIVILTVGVAIDKGVSTSMKTVWKHLYAARGNAIDGVRKIRQFEKVIKGSALPDGSPRNPERLAELAMTVPEMFRSGGKAAKPGAKPGAGTSAKAPATQAPARPLAKAGARRAAKPAGKPDRGRK